MLINKQLVGAALYSLIGAVSGQGVPGKPSLVAPKGATTLTVAVIGGAVNILSSPRWVGVALTVEYRLWLDWMDSIARSFLPRSPSTARSGWHRDPK
jgi:hypothetical protein